MFKRLFKSLKRFFKKFFGQDGIIDRLKSKLDVYGKEFTTKVDDVLKATKSILLIANDRIRDIEDLGFNVPDKIQEYIIEASQEVGYWDESIDSKEGFKSVAIGIAGKIKGSEQYKQGVVFNIAKIAIIKAFPELKSSEAELIVSASIALIKKKKKK